MFARSSTFEGTASAHEAAIEEIRDRIMPEMQGMPGFVGLATMCDPETGTFIATTSWLDAEAMHASADQVAPYRNRLGTVLGREAEVEEWEIAAMHRDHLTGKGNCCRVTWMRTNSADVDNGIRIYRDVLLPMLEELPGFCSASLFVDRENHVACATTAFDSREQMAASAEQSWAIRERGVRDAGVDITDVGEFDLAMAHLRVPEMA